MSTSYSVLNRGEIADATYTIEYGPYADPPFLRLEPLRVGEVPSTLPTPHRFVCVWRDEEPELRIDLHDPPPDRRRLRDPSTWLPFRLQDHHLLLPAEDALHFVDLRRRRARSTKLYTVRHVHPLRRGYLVLGAEEILRADADGHVRWTELLQWGRLLAVGRQHALVHGDPLDLGDFDYWRVDLRDGDMERDDLEL